MAQMGQLGDGEQPDEVNTGPVDVTLTTRSSSVREPGQLTVAELMRAQSAEHPRSGWARLFGINPVGTDSEQLFTRALGERAVGQVLAQLGDDWSVLHSVPVGVEGARLDHLVIGPAGVFTVTTRNHPGAEVTVSDRSVLIAGLKAAHIRDAEYDLGRAERRLSEALGESLAVTGLLVFVEPVSLTMRKAPKDLHVLRSSELLSWLETQSRVFDDAQVERVGELAALPTTWGAPPEIERTSYADELEILRRLVEHSRALRELWVGVIIIALVVTATALTTLTIVGMAPGGVVP